MRPILISMAHDLASGPGRSQMMLRSLLSVVLSTTLLREIFAKNLELGRESMRTIMERGQKLGEIRPDLEPLELARIFQHAMFGTLAIWGVGGPSDLSAWIDKTFDVVWCGIAAQNGPGSSKEKSL